MGVGMVMIIEFVKDVIDVGVKFLVSLYFDLDIVNLVNENKVYYFLGCVMVIEIVVVRKYKC